MSRQCKTEELWVAREKQDLVQLLQALEKEANKLVKNVLDIGYNANSYIPGDLVKLDDALRVLRRLLECPEYF